MVDREASSKRLEMRVKSLSSVTVAEEPNPSRDAATNMVSAAGGICPEGGKGGAFDCGWTSCKAWYSRIAGGCASYTLTVASILMVEPPS